MTPEQLAAAEQQAAELMEKTNKLRDEYLILEMNRRDLERTITAEKLKATGIEVRHKLEYKQCFYAAAPAFVEVEWDRMVSGVWRIRSVNGLKVENVE